MAQCLTRKIFSTSTFRINLQTLIKKLTMKTNKIIGFAIIVLMSFSANSLKAQYVKFGVFAEPQLSWFSSDTKDFSSDGAIFGFNAGFSLEKYFAERYAITSGASITNLGGALIYNNAGDSLITLDGDYEINQGLSATIKGQYLSIPLGLKFKTNEIGYMTFYADLGLKANVRLKGYAWVEDMNIDREVMHKSQMQFAFVSYYFGAGMQYSLGGPSSILLGLTYSNGLTHLLKDDYSRINVGTLGLKVGLVF